MTRWRRCGRTDFMFWQVFKLALENIRKYKVRSMLTMLGVIIGVMSVIFIAAIISVAAVGVAVFIVTQINDAKNNVVTH